MKIKIQKKNTTLKGILFSERDNFNKIHIRMDEIVFTVIFNIRFSKNLVKIECET